MRLHRRKLMIGVAGAAVAGLLPGAVSAGQSAQHIAGLAFGSTWRAVLPSATDPRAARSAVDAVVAAVDGAMSPYRISSDLSRFNASLSSDWIEMPTAAVLTLRESLRIAKLSGGAFDPTVGPLVNHFGFGPIRNGKPGDFAGVELQANAVKKAGPDQTLDLCAIAKGYALDLIAAALVPIAGHDFFVEFGGEIWAQGHHPDGRPWNAAIERPGAAPFAAQRIVQITGMAIATSGHAGNGHRNPGPRVSHIIDPRTARPLDNGLASVSVLAPTAQCADAWATALLVLGADAGSALAEIEGISALFLIERGRELRELTTGHFADHILA